MEIKLSRIGKTALLLAISDQEEEAFFKNKIQEMHGEMRAAVTFISGVRSKVTETFARSVLNTALQNNIINKKVAHMHAVMHAAMEAFQGIIPPTAISSSIKMKVAICADNHWVAVAVYGDSAVSTFTNHERCGFGLMHL